MTCATRRWTCRARPCSTSLEQPLIAAALAFAAGAALGAALPVTAKENELLGETSDEVKSRIKEAAQPLMSQAKDVLDDVVEEGKTVLNETMQQGKTVLDDTMKHGKEALGGEAGSEQARRELRACQRDCEGSGRHCAVGREGFERGRGLCCPDTIGRAFRLGVGSELRLRQDAVRHARPELVTATACNLRRAAGRRQPFTLRY